MEGGAGAGAGGQHRGREQVGSTATGVGPSLQGGTTTNTQQLAGCAHHNAATCRAVWPICRRGTRRRGVGSSRAVAAAPPAAGGCCGPLSTHTHPGSQRPQ